MIDTYFDRADAACGIRAPSRHPHLIQDSDPRYFEGVLYASATDARVAKARVRLAWVIDRAATQHSLEMRLGIPLGRLGILFTTNGARK